jgi:AcrR family transcriptional regulator
VTATAPSRSDARRNHERIVEVARELFVLRGVDISVRDIASAADIGLATLYRHFPTRDDLVDAVLVEAFEEWVALAEAALAAESGWDGFAGFLEQSLALHARDRGFTDAAEAQERGGEQLAGLRARMRVLLADIVARAHAEGTLRPDFTPEDATLVFWACARTIELAGGDRWRRQLGFILDGLKAVHA